jgi:archaellum component FlaC
MATTIETDLKEVLARLDQRFDRLDQRLDKIDNDLTDLKVDMATVKTELSAVKEDVKDLNGRASAQIWALIVATVVKFGLFPNP